MPRFRSLYWLPAFLLILALAAGCGSKAPVEVNPEAVKKELVGKKWFCKEMFRRDVSGDVPLTLEFKEDGTVSGSGGCNAFSGTYAMEEGGLRFGPLAGTRKSCGPAADEQEFTYLSFLGRVTRAKVEEEELDLFIEGQLGSMHFTTSEGGGFSLW